MTIYNLDTRSSIGGKNSKTPLYTQKYFSPDNLYQTSDNFTGGHHEIIGKNLFNNGGNEAQGGAFIDQKDFTTDKTKSFLNSSKENGSNRQVVYI